ncbi:MAG: hypothetical protein J3K34DRAFT_523536 [Monoraphidium minutum]|nr:MAG: hypothetical protein J3K34DRAFT_523536 [Monoraphidium minutum]
MMGGDKSVGQSKMDRHRSRPPAATPHGALPNLAVGALLLVLLAAAARPAAAAGLGGTAAELKSDALQGAAELLEEGRAAAGDAWRRGGEAAARLEADARALAGQAAAFSREQLGRATDAAAAARARESRRSREALVAALSKAEAALRGHSATQAAAAAAAASTSAATAPATAAAPVIAAASAAAGAADAPQPWTAQVPLEALPALLGPQTSADLTAAISAAHAARRQGAAFAPADGAIKSEPLVVRGAAGPGGAGGAEGFVNNLAKGAAKGAAAAGGR